MAPFQYDHADAKGLIPRPVAKPADPKIWGVYARLLGARPAGKMGTGISWRWTSDNVMVQDRNGQADSSDAWTRAAPEGIKTAGSFWQPRECPSACNENGARDCSARR